MPGGEGVEGAGEKGHRLRRFKLERSLLHRVVYHKAIEMIQHGGTVEEAELPRLRLGKERQEFFVDACEAVAAQAQRQRLIGDQVVAQHAQRALVNGRVVMRHADQKQSKAAVGQFPRALRQ